ncbi:hypothetical protein C0J52_10193 [Blattella germanica]|nr:hypothetical protein C0J52_10193 [Blattella germanica]
MCKLSFAIKYISSFKPKFIFVRFWQRIPVLDSQEHDLVLFHTYSSDCHLIWASPVPTNLGKLAKIVKSSPKLQKRDSDESVLTRAKKSRERHSKRTAGSCDDEYPI